MSALDNMLADILKKALPPEIMEMLTPEKIAEFGDKINAYIADTRERLERIEKLHLDLPDIVVKIVQRNLEVEMNSFLERLDNDRHNNSGPTRGITKRIGSPSGSGSIGTGD